MSQSWFPIEQTVTVTNAKNTRCNHASHLIKVHKQQIACINGSLSNVHKRIFVHTSQSASHFLHASTITTVIDVVLSAHHVIKQEPWRGTACTLLHGLNDFDKIPSASAECRNPPQRHPASAKYQSPVRTDKFDIRIHQSTAPLNTPSGQHRRICRNKRTRKETSQSRLRIDTLHIDDSVAVEPLRPWLRLVLIVSAEVTGDDIQFASGENTQLPFRRAT